MVTDLIDGYEFRLNSITSSDVTVSSSIDENAAYQKIKEFVDTFNSVSTAIDVLTQKGLEEKGSFV